MAENQVNAAICIACGVALNANQHSYLLPSGSFLQQKYQVEKVLGEGGFGITYKAIDVVHSRPVAVKESWPEKAIRQGTTIVWPPTVTPHNRQLQLKQIATEATYISRCHHPSIVRVYDCFEANNTAYVVMALITGQPLSQLIKASPLPNQQVKRYFIQLAEALKAIHQVNLLHRDIKPENIIIDGQDRAILIDFGSTKEFIAGQTRKMSVTLTPGYAPLEQYSYESKRWPATDIYALCASMYEALTGKLPAPATERFASEALIPPRHLAPHIDPLLEQVIWTGMSMRVQERFQTADELLKALTGGEQIAKLIPVPSVSSCPEFILENTQHVIGRAEPGASVDIDLNHFSGSQTVSRQHGKIYRESGEWKIADSGSANGIFVKCVGQSRFERITLPQKLNTEDEIAFGKVRFRFETY
ncbi:MAG: protein kinase [Cyanophyceae cyanobacterium]